MGLIQISTDIVDTPCIGVCTLDDCGFCMGCRRSAEEIARWLQLSSEERRQVMDRLDQRS